MKHEVIAAQASLPHPCAQPALQATSPTLHILLCPQAGCTELEQSEGGIESNAQALEAAQDVPHIHAEATDVLITRAMAYLYESMGNLQASQLMLGRYSELLGTLAKRYGDLRPAAVPVLRRMTRARFSYRSRDNYRKWYKSNT